MKGIFERLANIELDGAYELIRDVVDMPSSKEKGKILNAIAIMLDDAIKYNRKALEEDGSK